MLAKLCKYFHDKEGESAHGAVILIDNEDIMRLLVAFSLMPRPGLVYRTNTAAHKIVVLGEEHTLDDNELWVALWEPVRINLAMLAVRSGLADCTAYLVGLLEQLKGARLIYPDGSISETATDLMSAMTVREIERATG
jgi:hypothetical protein